MRRFRRSPVAILVSLLTLGLLAPVSAQPATPSSDQPSAAGAVYGSQVALQHVTGGLSSPLGVVNAGDGTDRLFVLEKRGTVRVIAGGDLQPGIFLDIRGVSAGLTTDGERGLLGLAFHPSFETNRKLFVYFTNAGGDIVIAEFTANAGRTAVPVSSYSPLLAIEHSSRTNHNGGQLLFGPDGRLYAFTGDGGGGGDPDENAQDRNSLLGKVLRIAPNLSGGYSNPSGNPYLGATAGRDEIWAIGMRNPWRASFDRANGALWIADVGQGSWEEINRDLSNAAGRNYGWDCREGAHPFETAGCAGISFTDPVAEYGHGNGDCSVTGGYVYRGGVFSDLVGQYVLGDFCSGRIWTLDAAAAWPLLFHRDTAAMITSFGESESGELYMTDYRGSLYRIVAPTFPDTVSSPFIDDIEWLADEGITAGCGGGRFCPKSVVNRDQMAAFLSRALGLPATGNDYFADDNGLQLEPFINRLAEAGLTQGCDVNRYCPLQKVQRAHMATFLDRALGLPPTGTDFFSDDNGSIHEAAINRVAAAGITQGCGGGKFCPSAATTREQMAAFLHRADLGN